MENESDGKLFSYLALIEAEPMKGNAALGELMRRYQGILCRRCDRLCDNFPSLALVGDDLTNLTFWKATQRASTYKALDKPEVGADDHIRYTSAWLFTIAQRLLFDMGRQADRPLPFEREISEPAELSATDVAALLVDGHSERFEAADKPAVARAFTSLNEEWQMVVVWTVDKRPTLTTGQLHESRRSD